MSDGGIPATSVYMNAEDQRIIEELMQSYGLGRSALFRFALRRLYDGEERNKQERLLQIAEEIRQLA